MPKIDLHRAPRVAGSRYPSPYDEPCRGRFYLQLGMVADLTQFGVNLLTLGPGSWSSQRHWHAREDEFVYVLEGEVVLVEDEGEQTLGPGDCAGFKAGTRNGHHLQNRTTRDARILVVGSRIDDDHGEYSDIDLKFQRNRGAGSSRVMRKDGSPL
jgi:uncharacterized cupin superfamily protein